MGKEREKSASEEAEGENRDREARQQGATKDGQSGSKEQDLSKGDALIVVDAQNDFFPGGSLEVPGAREVIPVLNHYLRSFHALSLPIYATRDWHPAHHCSFKEQGGPWPVHCVAGTRGAEFHPEIHLPPSVVVISTATTEEKEAYSGFEGTDLHDRLQAAGVRRLFIGGLATEYCVFNTVRDGCILGYEVRVIKDAIRAVNVKPGDGRKTLEEMIRLGAEMI